MATLRVGDTAPDFELDGVDGSTGCLDRYALSDYAGSPVILSFYPADNSPVCTQQLVTYTRGVALLNESGIQLLAISPQDSLSHQRFAEIHGGFGFPLLSDVDKSVGRAYGILGLLDLYRRSTFLIGSDGQVRYTHRSLGPGLTYRPLEELVRLTLESDLVGDAE